MQLVENRHTRVPDLRSAVRYVDAQAPSRVRKFLSACPKYEPTPLIALPGLAESLGVRNIFYKDESQRLGLQSFKALGGTYAIMEILLARAASAVGRAIDPSQLLDPDIRAFARDLTFVCASDGNHGRSVAAGARLVGARCVVFLHGGVSEERVARVAALGAQISRTTGSYDDSVEEANLEAARNGWILVADTAVDASDEIPGLIMRGYTVVADEILSQLASRQESASHVFVQAGVGGLAAAMAGHLATRLKGARPHMIVVEPESSACLFESCKRGAATEIEYRGSTVYAMLECNRPSPLAWEILDQCGDAFMTVPDDMAAPAMRRLAFPPADDAAIVAGESGAAGLAALMAITGRPDDRKRVKLSADATVVLIGTEGATDPDVYEKCVGVSPGAALRGGH